MTSTQATGSPVQPSGSVATDTLRAQLEQQAAGGTPFTLKRAVGIVVPLAVEIAERHERGETLYVHPGSVASDGGGHCHISPELAQVPPSHPKDRACMAPEEREGQPGNARSSVYAIGAILYELVTLQSVGPGMQRPTQIVATLPKEIEAILGKALVADPEHRPDDLKALAQAIHNLSPSGSIPPPPADESHLDHDDGFDVDVSLSMLPPPPSQDGYGVAVAEAEQPETPSQPGAQQELAELKARLESDRRPRYVVVKDGMDHGPFSAVEVLQQIANHTFEENDVLKDTFSKEFRAIHDWPEFAPFAEHARLHRHIKAEKDAIEEVVVQERKSTRGKALIGIAAVGALLALAIVWLVTTRGSRSDKVAVQSDTATNVETDEEIKVKKKRRKGGGGVVGKTAGGIPILGGGMSCEGAQAKYVEEIKMGQNVPADITRSQYGAVLNNGSYLNGCGVPDNMKVNICAAVQNGRAVGVSVSTNPKSAGVSRCVAGAVRRLSFPAHPKLDVTRTSF